MSATMARLACGQTTADQEILFSASDAVFRSLQLTHSAESRGNNGRSGAAPTPASTTRDLARAPEGLFKFLDGVARRPGSEAYCDRGRWICALASGGQAATGSFSLVRRVFRHTARRSCARIWHRVVSTRDIGRDYE
jgi:hypothetical protein